MKKLVFKATIFIVSISAFLASCSSDYIEYKKIDQIMPDEILSEIKENMNIYEGDNPPMIEGVYLCSPWVLSYSSANDNRDKDSVGHIFADENIRFSNQSKNNKTLDIDLLSIGKYSVSYTGKGSFVSGNGDNFTAYFTVSGTKEKDGVVIATMKTAIVISGTKTEAGIKNIEYALTILEKNDPQGVIIDIGIIRICKDYDGLAVNSIWQGMGKGLNVSKSNKTISCSK